MFKQLSKLPAATLLGLSLLSGPALAETEQLLPDPLSQVRAEHVMISTDNYDETLAWYTDKLGFSVQHEWTVPEFPGVKLSYIELNGFLIEVVETPERFQEKRIPTDLGTALNDRGFGHLAFLAADVDAVAEELQKRGVKLVVPPTSFPDSGRRLIFIQDNNGNYIEFLTPLTAYEGRE
ncbi:MAG: VOC family protein [Pseudomonadota bacterium]